MRWLPGTRILTWVGDGAGTSRASVAVRCYLGCRLAAGGRAEAQGLEPATQVFGAATHHRREDPEVVVTNGEPLPVEVLALQLDRGRVGRARRGVGVVHLVEPPQVDGEALRGERRRVGEVDVDVVGAAREQLISGDA